jgi:hypothetical protein
MTFSLSGTGKTGLHTDCQNGPNQSPIALRSIGYLGKGAALRGTLRICGRSARRVTSRCIRLGADRADTRFYLAESGGGEGLLHKILFEFLIPAYHVFL